MAFLGSLSILGLSKLVLLTSDCKRHALQWKMVTSSYELLVTWWFLRRFLKSPGKRQNPGEQKGITCLLFSESSATA
jgi:hypothetical protein